MDLGTIFLSVALINVGVFLAGCALAMMRTWHDLRRVGRPARAVDAHR